MEWIIRIVLTTCVSMLVLSIIVDFVRRKRLQSKRPKQIKSRRKLKRRIREEKTNFEQADGNEHPAIPDTQLVLYKIAAEKDNPFKGQAILHALLSNGFTAGKDGLFYYHEEKNGQGEVLFSLASTVEPGYFDLENINDHETFGLVMYMYPARLQNKVQAFAIMMESLKRISFVLGGEVLDSRNNKPQDELVSTECVVEEEKEEEKEEEIAELA